MAKVIQKSRENVIYKLQNDNPYLRQREDGLLVQGTNLTKGELDSIIH